MLHSIPDNPVLDFNVILFASTLVISKSGTVPAESQSCTWITLEAKAWVINLSLQYTRIHHQILMS